MASSPPVIRGSVPPTSHGVSVDVRRFAAAGAEDLGVCFAIEGAALDAGHSKLVGDATVLTTQVRGRVADVLGDELTLDDDAGRTRVRFILPAGVSLAGLLDRFVSVEVTHRIRPNGSTIIDASIRDGRGRLLLWAHDGALSTELRARALQLRITHPPDGEPRLAIGAGKGAVTTVEAGSAGRVDGGDASYVALVLRVGPGDASYVLVRC